MTNHMAQGAATSMEDGAFLGCVIAHVIDGSITIPQAIQIYEQTRMPFVWYKQQVSFLNGALWHLPDGLLQEVCAIYQTLWSYSCYEADYYPA